MNKRYILSILLFGGGVLFLTINFLSENRSFDDEFYKLVVSSSALVYVVIYFIYVVIFQHYSKWKQLFYDTPISHIRKTIERRKRFGDDLWSMMGLSVLVNFFVVYFVLITTPNQIISRIPGFEGVMLFSNTANTDMFDIIGNVSRFDYFFPLTIIGLIILFILRFLWLRRIDGKRGHPGTNPLLAFMYVVFGIIILQGLLIILDIGETNYDSFFLKILFSAALTLFGFLSIPVAVILDRFLLRNLNLK